MSEDINITDTSGNNRIVLTQPEYSVTAITEDWSPAQWNNGKVDFSTLSTAPGDRLALMNWYSRKRCAESP